MKKFALVICMVAVAAFVACGKKQVKEETNAPAQPVQEVNVKSALPAGEIVEKANKDLSKASFDGFAYKSSSYDTAKWDSWGKAAAPTVKAITSKLPEGYVLQITGHTDSKGPEDAEGSKPGNSKLSTERAKTVYNALKKQGVDPAKMVYKGAGSSELLSGVASDSAKQRRVSFKVVEK